MLITGLVVFGIANVAAGLAPTTEVMLAARVSAGVGAAMIMPITLAVITSTFPEEQRGKAIGVWTGVAGGGGILGMYLSALLVDIVDWRWLFVLPVVLVAIALAMTLRSVPTPRAVRPSFRHSRRAGIRRRRGRSHLRATGGSRTRLDRARHSDRPRGRPRRRRRLHRLGTPAPRRLPAGRAHRDDGCPCNSRWRVPVCGHAVACLPRPLPGTRPVPMTRDREDPAMNSGPRTDGAQNSDTDRADVDHLPDSTSRRRPTRRTRPPRWTTRATPPIDLRPRRSDSAAPGRSHGFGGFFVRRVEFAGVPRFGERLRVLGQSRRDRLAVVEFGVDLGAQQ